MIIQILGLALIGFFISDWFKPIQQLKDYFKVYNIPYIGMHLYCVKCVTFWLTLIVTHNIYYAVIASLVSYIVKYITDTIERTYDKF